MKYTREQLEQVQKALQEAIEGLSNMLACTYPSEEYNEELKRILAQMEAPSSHYDEEIE